MLTGAADAIGLVDWPLSVDSTIARTNQHATNTKRPTGGWIEYKNLTREPRDHTVGRSRGGLSTKTHQLVDCNGLPLVSHLRTARDVGRPPNQKGHR